MDKESGRVVVIPGNIIKIVETMPGKMMKSCKISSGKNTWKVDLYSLYTIGENVSQNRLLYNTRRHKNSSASMSYFPPQNKSAE